MVRPKCLNQFADPSFEHAAATCFTSKSREIDIIVMREHCDTVVHRPVGGIPDRRQMCNTKNGFSERQQR
jgi:hypothetical protein